MPYFRYERRSIRTLQGNKEATVVGRPMTIETNMQNRHVKLIMPLKDVVLTPNEMKDLGIYIEHSDGTKELLQGVLVPYNNKGEMGLEFTVNKFSTFTLVHIEGLGELKQHTAYMNGYEDNTFKSENMITRAEIAAILSRVITRATAKADIGYSDVASAHWAKDAISNVTKMGLMQGYSDGSFAPEKSISRAEMASLASALLGDTQQLGTGFTDITSHWAQAYIIKSQGTGIISGYADGTFKPENSLTRAEAVTILNKVLGRSTLNGVAQSSWKDVSNTHWALRDIEEASVDHTFKKTTDGGEQWVQKP
ncbi:S-layer homology domain-containing protein [Paenibacillus qinlingensis]|uniref:S-layer homology domain-containing protein n=1 Tax=Paenibacillus qinlingensis TaxID=1837343 RepID=UPI0015632AF6|nr:S-layer homology domain-containing protein [Paenibacillus qinlingensis]NQX59284.1 S-layer homology domain-containing protein [Paenibacillus qinlingensis]